MDNHRSVVCNVQSAVSPSSETIKIRKPENILRWGGTSQFIKRPGVLAACAVSIDRRELGPLGMWVLQSGAVHLWMSVKHTREHFWCTGSELALLAGTLQASTCTHSTHRQPTANPGRCIVRGAL